MQLSPLAVAKNKIAFALNSSDETVALSLSHEEAAELFEYLDDHHIDDSEVYWTKPTAWAYFAVCRALHKLEDKLSIAEMQLHELQKQR